MKFKVGDRVRFKTWEEMKEEFGISASGNIPCKFTFLSTMDALIDRGRDYIISDIRGDSIYFEDLSDQFSYSEDMIRLVSEYAGENSNDLLWKGLSVAIFNEDYLGNRMYRSGVNHKGVSNLIGAIALKTMVESSEDYKARIE